MAAAKSAIRFSVRGYGDDSSTVLYFTLASQPFWFHPSESVSQSAALQPTFDLTTLHPADVKDFVCPTAGIPELTAASITTFGTRLQLTFASAPPSSTYFDVLGTLVF